MIAKSCVLRCVLRIGRQWIAIRRASIHEPGKDEHIVRNQSGSDIACPRIEPPKMIGCLIELLELDHFVEIVEINCPSEALFLDELINGLRLKNSFEVVVDVTLRG